MVVDVMPLVGAKLNQQLSDRDVPKATTPESLREGLGEGAGGVGGDGA